MGMTSMFSGIEPIEGKFPTITALSERFNRQSEAVTMSIINSHPWHIPADDKTWLRARDKLSIYGTEYYDKATEEERRRLSILEIGTWWQGFVMFERFVTEYYLRVINDGNFAAFPTIVEYMHHFCREEINHSMVFEKAMMHFAVEPFPRMDQMSVADTYVTYGKDEYPLTNIYLTLIIEWIADLYQRMDIGPETHPLCVAVVKEHQKEEARHIAWAQEMIKSLCREQPRFLEEARQFSAPFMRGFLDGGVTNIECFNRIGFKDPAFADQEKLIETLIASPHRQKLHQKLMKPVFDFMLESAIYNPEDHQLWVGAGFEEDVANAFQRKEERRRMVEPR
jgi:hypothetical protein